MTLALAAAARNINSAAAEMPEHFAPCSYAKGRAFFLPWLDDINFSF